MCELEMNKKIDLFSEEFDSQGKQSIIVETLTNDLYLVTTKIYTFFFWKTFFGFWHCNNLVVAF